MLKAPERVQKRKYCSENVTYVAAKPAAAANSIVPHFNEDSLGEHLVQIHFYLILDDGRGGGDY